MTLSLVGAPAAGTTGTGGNNAAAVWPTSYTPVADDFAVMVLVSKNRTESVIPSTPAGWTQAATALGGITGSGVDQGRVRITVYTRTLAAGDAAPTVSQTSGTGNLLMLDIWVWRKSAAGTYTLLVNHVAQTTSSLSWSGATSGTPDWNTDDQLIVSMGATSDVVTGFGAPAVTATGLTVGAYTEHYDFGNVTGDDIRMAGGVRAVTAGPATTAATLATTLTGTASSGNNAIIRIRHVPAAVDATVTPATVAATATVGTVIVDTGQNPDSFTVSLSSVGGIDQLGFGGPSSHDVVLIMTGPVQATATVGIPSLWGAPSGLTATPVSATEIHLEWNAVLAADGYMVERDGVVIADNIVVTEYDDQGLTADTEYDYRVQAFR